MRTLGVLGHGAAAGVFAWLTYALVEYLMVVLVPLARWNYTLPVAHWKWTGIQFSAYMAAGAVFGAVAARAADWCGPAQSNSRARSERLQVLSTMTVVVAFAANIASAGWSARPVELAGCLLLLAALAQCCRDPLRVAWWQFTRLPWVACFLLLSLAKLSDSLSVNSTVIRHGAGGLLLVTAFLACLALARRQTTWWLMGPSSGSRRLVTLGCAGAGLLAASFLSSPAAPDPKSPPSAAAGPESRNIIWVVMDTVRADHCSAYGYPRNTTPFLRKLAGEGMLFRGAIATTNLTLGTHASMFTGLYVSTHGAHFSPSGPRGRRLPKGIPTLARILTERGYRTMAVSANPVLGDFDLLQGFQVTDRRLPLPAAGVERWCLRRPLRALLSLITPTLELDRYVRRGDEITNSALALLSRVRGDGRPYFLFLNYLDAHMPYLPPPPFDALFGNKSAKCDLDHLRGLIRPLYRGERTLESTEREHIVSQYDGGIAYVDHQIGRLMEQLKQWELYDQSLIIITADHGEWLGEKGLLEHSVFLHQEQVHVPLVIKYPGSRTSGIVEDWVSDVDLMPTILDVLNYPVPPGLQGRSLRRIESLANRPVFTEAHHQERLKSWRPDFPMTQQAVLLGSMKLISSSNGSRELYNLDRDPKEERNLHRAGDPAAAELETVLTAWAQSARRRQDSSERPDRKTIERLRTLGYVQ